jgi:hypothetical protein
MAARSHISPVARATTELAITGRRDDGWYMISQLTVE